MATISASPRVVSERLVRPRLSVTFEAPAAPMPAAVLPSRLRDLPAVRLAVAVVMVFAAALTAFLMAPTADSAVPATAVHVGPLVAESAARPAWTVAPGETLWSIAEQVAPGEDPRRVVMELQALNGFGPGHTLQVGEVIQVTGRS
ncbi:MAG: LysM peptidoglycan-binding domain-containing protein [Candidatus Nanopelagicales bacterium]|nr:LysM peptidoglycan-binding domain-containing protein [Candidatus Nanopelagicales bacterium]MCU0297761.1 LysM peptidoglycan-binding domain-containing protein [Candidatus Nanopelagicales bacterium]